jgi:RimJ/RimL family protein N-acetyltransferase
MTLRLRRLDEAEAAALAPGLERRYAEDIEHNGGFSPEAARAKAAEDIPRVLADPKSTMYGLEDEGEWIGHLWVGERQLQGRRCLWIWDIQVNEAHRGRGYGRSAMLLVEEEARRLGLERIELNVFGGNEVARGLYRAVGYDEIAVSMGKDLA